MNRPWIETPYMWLLRALQGHQGHCLTDLARIIGSDTLAFLILQEV